MEVEEGEEEDDDEEDSDEEEEEEEEEEEVRVFLHCSTRFPQFRVIGRLPGNRPLRHPGSRRETQCPRQKGRLHVP